MEPREVQSPAGGLQVQQPQQMLMGHTSSSYPSNSGLISSNPTANNIPPSSTPCFPFNSLSSPVPLQRHQQQQQQQQQQQPKPLDSLNSVGFDGSPQFRYNTEPAAMKKKRGRPRKYAPDGNIALLQLAPTTPIASNSANHGDGDSVGLGSNSGVAGGGAVSEPPAKRNRGRPPGSSKRQMDALGGVGGVGFTPHVITVEAGEDIASKVMAFSQQGPRTVCILSANGAISNVTLRQPAMSCGTVTYEGRFEIISLSGSFLLSENNGSHSRSGGLSVSLAGSDGRVLGGGVAGMLHAASPVQVSLCC
uniref:AT-hook motif nuclear-localized protein n=1 Tax=Gossypium raimondii TaxID=29730 RepID=A0A0D2U7W0_GOSRA|nr:hypothetical protein B456_008G227100 [Gossypium raimondii]